eukprot:TRINITY_DN1644_c0_g1_i1.p1 TRINITY_DN1644_c0_g1~~TRINITY_DN1644_c0_g1_i1.p1  ORF type:complete len:195 (+),score=28.66 TRINITY_DN1644_c0_g1_i1:75-659(+)
MAANKSKFMQWIDYRIRVTISDGRMLLGTFLAFDKHLNLVLSDTEEFRTIKPKKQGENEILQKRSLGMVILRGENVVSINIESQPNQAQKRLEPNLGGKQTNQQRQTQLSQIPTLPVQNITIDPAKGFGQPQVINPQIIPPQFVQPTLTQQTPSFIPQNLATDLSQPPSSFMQNVILPNSTQFTGIRAPQNPPQ